MVKRLYINIYSAHLPFTQASEGKAFMAMNRTERMQSSHIRDMLALSIMVQLDMGRLYMHFMHRRI